VARRPLALVRCPSGAEQGCFFQKHSWAGLSDFILRDKVRDDGGEEEVLLVENISGVVAMVQAGVLEIHPWGATIDDVEHPDRITMDLDPGEDVSWPEVIAAAGEVRERLRALGLDSFVKTTGGKGLHVVVPLKPQAGWDEVKAFTRALAESMEADSPQRYISKATKKARRGLIYVDYLRNGRGATAIAAYSTRARPGAPVSVPLSWDELSPAIKPNHFTVKNLPARLQRMRKDPWAALFKSRQTLPSRPGKRKPR
jgi:bifunctional non-homologous end joining protein LigD